MLREPFGIARAVCFEEPAGVFASSGAMHYAKFAVSRKNRPVLPGQRANILLNCTNDAATRKKQLVLPRQRRNFLKPTIYVDPQYVNVYLSPMLDVMCFGQPSD